MQSAALPCRCFGTVARPEAINSAMRKALSMVSLLSTRPVLLVPLMASSLEVCVIFVSGSGQRW